MKHMRIEKIYHRKINGHEREWLWIQSESTAHLTQVKDRKKRQEMGGILENKDVYKIS